MENYVREKSGTRLVRQSGFNYGLTEFYYEATNAGSYDNAAGNPPNVFQCEPNYTTGYVQLDYVDLSSNDPYAFYDLTTACPYNTSMTDSETGAPLNTGAVQHVSRNTRSTLVLYWNCESGLPQVAGFGFGDLKGKWAVLESVGNNNDSSDPINVVGSDSFLLSFLSSSEFTGTIDPDCTVILHPFGCPP